jgi:hypothetical protein
MDTLIADIKHCVTHPTHADNVKSSIITITVLTIHLLSCLDTSSSGGGRLQFFLLLLIVLMVS